jgi:hypothetical protein
MGQIERLARGKWHDVNGSVAVCPFSVREAHGEGRYSQLLCDLGFNRVHEIPDITLFLHIEIVEAGYVAVRRDGHVAGSNGDRGRHGGGVIGD